VPGRILVVDDEAANGEVVARMLERQGHTVELALNGTEALARIRSSNFDLLLLDLMMPGIGGDQVLREIKNDSRLRHLPVIMISAMDEQESVIACIESGAEDYLPKPFNPTLLHARISAILERKRFRDQELTYLNTIEQTQRRLKAELGEAENYIRSILPPPCSHPIAVDWRIIPSTELGGDSFGYHSIDEDHFALYLLDVCGHGVGAALLSVAAINVLRSSALPGIEFRDPGAVLAALNETFPMERQNFMYFTIWYGVWQVSERKLRYASAGHPPALLVVPGADGRNSVETLVSEGPVIGAIPGVKYETKERQIPVTAQVYVVSDGTFEIKRADGTMWPTSEFFSFFAEPAPAGESELDRLFARVKDMHGPGPLEDDFSILRFKPR
jgi:sigma-B regulation protein RsbU (phosphoserine phosphatase)